MKKISFFGALLVLGFGLPTALHAAYPAFTGYNGAGNNGRTVYLPTTSGNVVATNSVAAANQTRVTGALPRVGSSAINAGRRYYQSSDFDRLADSGLYIGLSAAYTASVMGEFSADYEGEYGDFKVPGAFASGSFEHDTMVPLQLSLGATINSDLRIDFSYSRYSGLSYPQSVQTADGSGGYVTATGTGGAITSNAALLNLYYNIDSYTGYLAGGALRPYVGAGVGIALNTIADYVVFDGTMYYLADPPFSDEDIENANATSVTNISGYHNGGTKEQLAFSLEGGVTTELGDGMKLDLFIRYMHLGKVQSSGSIILTQDEYFPINQEYEDGPLQTVAHYTDWTESANLNTIDVGARLRLQF